MLRTIAMVAVALGVTACSTGQQSPTPSTTTTMPASGGQQVVIAEGPASPRGQVRHQVAGRITDIERQNGEITVRSSDGSKVKLMLPPVAVANMRPGDDVSLDVVVIPRR